MPIPKYAEGVPSDRLVEILCRGTCGTARYAEVNRSDWHPKDDWLATGLRAKCLKCGYEAEDPYNWICV